MKICPRCHNICDDEDKYCVECKTNIENEKIIKKSKMKLSRRKRTNIGCMIVVIAVVVVAVIVLAVFGFGDSGFGSGYLDFVAERRP